jgi:hypothetical protein
MGSFDFAQDDSVGQDDTVAGKANHTTQKIKQNY